MRRVLVQVSGYVQGVGYRANCQRQAHALGLTGWVRNRWDGSVEALFEGADHAVDRMIAWCWQGPPRAEVTSVEVREAPEAPPLKSFAVRVL
jgi:acylphosphatase